MSEAIATGSTATPAARACNTNTPAQPAGKVQWWIVIKKHKTFQLHLLDHLTSQTGVTVMHSIRGRYKSTKPTRHWWHSELKIEEAIVSPVSSQHRILLHVYP
jgi:hypothetical protein